MKSNEGDIFNGWPEDGEPVKETRCTMNKYDDFDDSNGCRGIVIALIVGLLMWSSGYLVYKAATYEDTCSRLIYGEIVDCKENDDE